MKAFLFALAAAARTSEFWVFLGQAWIEIASVPVPEEFNWFSWGYIAFRLIGKIVRYVIPAPKKLVLVLALFALPAAATAQEPISLLDVGHRAHVTVNGGAMVLTTGDDWSGASLGGTVLYNLHPKLSVFGGYDHGFPINDVDAHLNLYRAVGSVRVHPNAFIGFGYAWFDKGVEGGLAQLIITRRVAPRLAVGGLYAHVFSREELADFEYARVYVNYHLFGSE